MIKKDALGNVYELAEILVDLDGGNDTIEAGTRCYVLTQFFDHRDAITKEIVYRMNTEEYRLTYGLEAYELCMLKKQDYKLVLE